MSISIQWDNPEKTALIPWHWNEYESLSDRIEDMFNSTTRDIDLIIDLSYAGDIPADVVAQLRDAYADGEPNLGQYIFVGASSQFVEQLAIADRYFTALGGTLDYRCVDTLAEAQRINRWKNLIDLYDANLM